MGFTFLSGMFYRKDLKILYSESTQLKCFWLFAAYALIVALVHKNLIGTGAAALYILLTLFALYANTIVKTTKIRMDFVMVVCYGSIISFIVAVAQDIYRSETAYRPISVFEETNYYAFMCELMIIVITYALLHYKKRALYFVALAASFGGLVESGCRSAWPAVFCGVLVIFICLKRKKHLRIGLIGGAIALVCVIVFRDTLLPRYRSFMAEIHMRVNIWQTAVSIFKTHPIFGQGMLTYSRMETKGIPDFHAHNLFLESLCDFGIVGTIFFTGCVILLIWTLIRYLKKSQACAVSLGAITVTLVHGIVDEPFMQLQCSAMLFLLIAFSGLDPKKLTTEDSE